MYHQLLVRSSVPTQIFAYLGRVDFSTVAGEGSLFVDQFVVQPEVLDGFATLPTFATRLRMFAHHVVLELGGL